MENTDFSREKALPFSLEKLETIFNNLIQRDTYSNKILKEPLSKFYRREIKSEGKYRDNFLQIVEYTLSPLEKIAKNPKRELLKISELQSINEIRSTDYKTMIWLGNKPGKTLAEKIGAKGKILAPKNKYSIDKKENRVVVYYFKEAYKILEERYKRYIENSVDIPENLKKIYERFYRIKREMINNELFSLDRPIDFSPNNTLIDHRDYSVVNRGLKYLKKYLEKLDYSEDILLELAKKIVFLKLSYFIAGLENIDIFDEILDIEELLKSKKKIIKFYSSKLQYLIKVILDKSKSKIRIEFQKIFFNRDTKEVEKRDKEILDIDIIDTYESSVPYYKLKVKDIEYNFNDEDLKKILFENIKIDNLIKNKKESMNSERFINKGIYMNFNSQSLFIDNEALEIRSYNKKLDNFMDVKDNFLSQNEQQAHYHINEIVSLDETIDIFPKYLEYIKEKRNIDKQNICIYSSLEALDSDSQKMLSSIYDSNFNKSYPIWRSILATYSTKSSDKKWLETKDKFYVLDLNIEIPTINTIEKERNTNRHHPVMILEENENEELKELSLKAYLKEYLEKYLNVYSIEMDEVEKNFLISSGKVYETIFKRKRYLINNMNFYLERDQRILTNIGNKFYSNAQKFVSKFLTDKRKKILIISDYLGEKYSINGIDVKVIKEKELSLGKDEIIEKIKNNKKIWNEYLPNLTLETVKDGHFYNLDLIKENEDIEIIFGKAQVININEDLVLPKDMGVIKFPLYSQDSNNKKLYFLEIKSELFPLKENLVVNLELIYSYGSKDPYKIKLKTNGIDSLKFSTKWTENINKLKITSLDYPEKKNKTNGILDIEKILKKIDLQSPQLKEYLKRNKNRLRADVIEEIERGNLEVIKEVLDRNSKILALLEILNKQEKQKDLLEEIAVFLASFGVLIYDRIKVDILKFDYRKRRTLFLYSLNEQLKLEDVLKYDKKDSEIIETVAEISWLDKVFINKLAEKEPELLERALKFLKYTLKSLTQKFGEEYKKWSKKNLLWIIANRFKNYLEFILAILTIKDKEEILRGLDKREILKMLYDIKAIDRKIQLDYPKLKEEFDKSVKFDFGKEIIKQKKEVGLEAMSDLAYIVYCYLSGNDGSEAIKIKEVLDDFND
ncbi:hypothetical protein FNCP11_01180 [Fusobacterium nucleatum]|uniref:hypothetical protein n=1 Tax=Fusobacterium nucleatum subsp. polymorphum TaxID=76857 RepID=UPI0029254FA3|nr:hypothetical protein FNCP11_01180 [Fusobacterium nucleatum]BEP09193.1 hypothetical protein FNSP11_00370 [Fusobacterium nucleatum]